MKQIVIGLGEVGSALQEILACDGHDPFKGIEAEEEQYDILHICFNWSPTFGNLVLDYQKRFDPKYVVVHSTVPIGTCRQLGVAHSPIRGRHPHLAESIRTFKKYVGGKDSQLIATIMRSHGIPAVAVESADDTEAGKLFDLMQFGAMVLLNKEIHDFCEKNGLDFDIVYARFNESYNEGYTALRHPEFSRPNLKFMEGPIGGHCVVSMMELLNTETADRILGKNELLKKHE